MYLSKSNDSGDFGHSPCPHEVSPAALRDIVSTRTEDPAAEEKPGRILLELCVLVTLLHLWIIFFLPDSPEQSSPAKPMIMQASLISAPESKPRATLRPKQPMPPITPKKPLPKPKSRPIVRKKLQPLRKPDALRPPEPADETMKAAPDPVPAITSTASAPDPTSKTGQTQALKTDTFTEANYRANYAFNPKPNYPRLARSRGWQGKVLLRVQVTAEGASNTVTIDKSSGHAILDESAVEAVRKWRFIPARRGETAVASSVVVPILFTLQN
ncbi:MAG: energy transducer TonB [Gammaproteobacteria bacterium]